MRRLASIVLAATLAAVGGACDDGVGRDHMMTGPTGMVVGSGRFVTEMRHVHGFTSVSVTAGGTLIVTPGGESLEITAEDNIMPFVEATVVDGQLTLGMRNMSGSVSTRGVTYRVRMPDVRAVMASAGSRVEMMDLHGPHMRADLSGGATLRCSGEMEHFELHLSGGSRCDASELHSRRVTATMSGGSSAIVHAIESLVVDASSGSMCEYLGNPSVQAHMSSAGMVRRR